MDASNIFNYLIGESLEGLILKYDVYKSKYDVHPYHHVIAEDFEKNFSDLLFNSMVFYAYEKEEIENEYEKGRFGDLRKAARAAYEIRIPKTERENDGLFGELALDSFLKCFFPNMEMLYSRVKYLERYPKKKLELERKGHEVKGYDGLLFSSEEKKKYMWVGQVKTGDWQYCLSSIKDDINKSILEHYFSSAMIILADIMRSANGRSSELLAIIDHLNDLIFEHSSDTSKLHREIIDYFKKENIIVRIPCLIIANEENYSDSDNLLSIVKTNIAKAFSGFSEVNRSGLNTEIILLVLPVRNIKAIREEFLKARKDI